MADLHALCDDLAAEHAALDVVLDALRPADWQRPTPADGWSIRDQVAHLYFGDNRALLTATDPDAYVALRDAELADREHFAAAMISPELGSDGPTVLAAWRAERARLLDAYRGLDPKARVAWYGPPMSPLSKVTARIMETWAHGQDVVDAVGATRPPTARLRHVAHIGVGARRFSYTVHDREVDETPVFVALGAPDGDVWTWGDPDAAVHDAVRGTALDFCLVVTQRRHIADTHLEVHGPAAAGWMAIAQAYAGPSGEGRSPGQFPKAPT